MPDLIVAPTTVINVARLTKPQRAAIVSDPTFVYCGRAFAGWPGSLWGNPFKNGMSAESAMRTLDRAGVAQGLWPDLAGPLTVEQAVACYEWVIDITPGMIDRIRRELRGKRLGCWCLDWAPGDGPPKKLCHAYSLARYADWEPSDLRENDRCQAR